MSAAASAGYRRLLRSIQVAFSGDTVAIAQAKKQLREEFIKFRGVTDSTTLGRLFKDIDDVDEMLRFHIVQGKKNKKGSYDVNFRDDHQETIAAGQSERHGPELEPVDPSLAGRDSAVQVNKAVGTKKPFEEVQI